MDAFKISVKFYVEDDSQLRPHEFVPILHSWIQNRLVPDHMLIDVADYEHVHNGPGTLLVAHEANFYTDRFDGRLGLMYSRKMPWVPEDKSSGSLEGSFVDRLRQAFKAALEACDRLESDSRLAGRIRFSTNEAAIRLDDRLLAPNTPETFEQVRPDIERFARELYAGSDVEIEHYPSPRTLLEIHMQASDAPGIATLLHRLSAARAAAV
jgi:hypothetical protein